MVHRGDKHQVNFLKHAPARIRWQFMHHPIPLQHDSGPMIPSIIAKATFKGLLSLWSLEIILVCSYSHPCQDELGPVSSHILHSSIQNGLQNPKSTSLYSTCSLHLVTVPLQGRCYTMWV